MQDRQLANNCCFSNLNQSTPYPSNLTSFLSGINQVGSFKLLGLIASASSFGVTNVWQQAAQAETNLFSDSPDSKETFVAELETRSLETNKTISTKGASTAIVDNQSKDNSDLDHSTSNPDQSLPISQPNFSFNLQQSSFNNIPQLPSLAVNTLHQEKAAKNLYTVRAGDTIVGIARKHGISSRQIIKANRLVNPNLIKVNRQLIIPSQEFTKGFARSVAFKSRKYSLNNSFINPEPSKKTYLNFSKSPKSDRDTSPAKIVTDVQNRTVVSKSKDPYISKLRQDIVKLRSEYQQQLKDDRIESPQANNVKNPKTLTAINRVNLNQPLSKTPINNSINASPSSERISNPLISTIKNFALAPKLPPLASPEEYLPNDPISKGYVWPAQGNLTSGYGWRWGRLHKGIDIAAPIGTPIVAAASGEVIFAGWNTGGYGNLVKLKHDDGSVTLYAHNNRVLIRSGQQVKQGQLIAEMGSTGRSSGPHLHFEIRPNGSSAINPIARLPKK